MVLFLASELDFIGLNPELAELNLECINLATMLV